MGCRLRTNQLPLISAVPSRSESALAAHGYSTTWWCSARIQQASGYSARAIFIPLICSAETMTNALVKEKYVSACEFKRITPRPLGSKGGSIIGNALAQISEIL